MIRSADSSDPNWQGLYIAGAISAAIALAIYVVGFVLIFVTATPPEDASGEEMLVYVHDHRALYFLKQLLWLVPSLPLVIVSIALATACFRLSRGLSLVAGVIASLSWAGSFMWPTTGEGSLAMPLLADGFRDAATDADRAPFIAGAETLMAINDMATPLGVLQTIGIFLLGIAMLKGTFATGLAWLGIITGTLGIVAETFRLQLGMAYAVYGILLFAWLIWVALALWKLGTELRHQAQLSSRMSSR